MLSSALNGDGLLIILSSPSGAGKSSLAKKLVEDDTRVRFSVSVTTRQPRDGETEGKEYFFTSEDDFNSMIEKGKLLEYAEVFGYKYGTPKESVALFLEKDTDVLFDVDWQGGTQIRNSEFRDHVVSIFVLPPTIKELEKRLSKRGLDSPETIKHRMGQSKSEISHWAEYDYVLINDNFAQVVGEIRNILFAERLRRKRRSTLVGFVKELDEEFEMLLK